MPLPLLYIALGIWKQSTGDTFSFCEVKRNKRLEKVKEDLWRIAVRLLPLRRLNQKEWCGVQCGLRSGNIECI